MLAILAGAIAGCGGGGSGDSSVPVNVALSGVIDIEVGTRVDADTADVLLLNDTPLSSPQVLPPEYLLAGYVSATDGSYAPLSGFAAAPYFADPEDVYTVNLKSGQRIYLQAFASRAGVSSLDVVLSEGGTVIDSASSDANSTEVSVALPTTEADGTYTITVSAGGNTPMLYVLSSSVATAGEFRAFEWPDYEFVEGEALVALADDERAGANSLAVAGEFKREIGKGLWRVAMPPAGMAGNEQSRKAATLEWIREMRSRQEVRSAEPNYRMRAMATPLDEPLYNSPTLGQQWHYSLLNAPTAWQIVGNGGQGVTVAVMDTGLFASSPGAWHSDIAANVLSPLPLGADFVDDDSDPRDPGNDVGSSVYHGTHVAGTVAAVVNGSGGAGVAYESNLLPVRVLGEGGTGSSEDLLDALQWIAGPDAGSPRADVVNLSLGGLPYISSLQSAINTATDRGIVFVAAAGNSASTAPSYPAAFDNVLAVSAVDGAGQLSTYSNYGSWVDVAAPGGDASRDGNADGYGDLVSSTSATSIDGSLQETYIGLQGTSMAAPHVSAVLALMKNVKPTLEYGAISALLQSGQLTSCAAEPCAKTSELGWGLLDAGKAVLAATDGVIPAILVASPAIVSLSSEGSLQQTVTVSLLDSESGDATITAVTEAADWLTVDVSPDPPGTVSSLQLVMTLHPELLDSGVSERATVTISYTTDQARSLDIPVVGQTVSDLQARNAGRHFVLLVNPEPTADGFYESVAQTSSVAEDGLYTFSFIPDDGVSPTLINEVPPGNYILVAGTDLDNDGLICHAGEACAEYPVAGLREEITIEEGQPITGIRMTTSYTRPTISASSPNQLPRPDFSGYRLLDRTADTQTLKTVATP
ncbi:S8 family serine peptidase [Marinobacter salinexigens]|uniref:S8 family serine peptidase n=2 Tax=Marinobacter salinexigens TaxID=2919747 RepID=A0A5B0VPC7_9GAMM|nr:S8 family serine peptidase [Marinobacter salinexigens]